ncbi:uncharacterized protein LOC126828737 [Patella vulgata]|uniref:uncharacterized protein LOC126828737 n=1 Tax=Patella vulgata TaxID=6465 RepID=UPI0024A9C6CC|nr:uncharacterized protein LOC126828737 [Patella vulgata]
MAILQRLSRNILPIIDSLVHFRRPTSTKILYDGECKICLAEISILRRLPSKKTLEFVDITKEEYKPELYNGITYEDAMKEMHVIANEKVYVKADAIRKMYDEVGLTWLANFTRLPKIAPYWDKLYVKFAQYRLERALKNCDTGSCSVKLKALKGSLHDKS